MAESFPSFEALVERTEGLPYRFPTEANRIERLGARAVVASEIAEQARWAYPLVHEDVLTLAEGFLADRRARGSQVERALYQGMGVAAFFERLLRRRPLAFLTSFDSYLLRDGRTEGSGGFSAIGTDEESPPLVLADYNSYREMLIAALVGVSTPTYFINEGDRGNRARPGAPGTFEEQGVYVGLVGARFERKGQMEWRHMIVTPTQNTAQNGFGPFADPESDAALELELWARFYGEGDEDRAFFPDWDTAEDDEEGDFVRCGRERLLNTRVYRRRMRMSVEPFLIEANERARAAGRPGYVVAVGLGLGVWQICPEQGQLLVDVYRDVLEENRLEHLSDLDFSWFPSDCQSLGGAGDGERLLLGGNDLVVHFGKRSPAARLSGADQGKLLVASFAWDGNAYPGNEYWQGSLSASGDPAAACCSTIPELANGDVNPAICGENTRIAGSGEVTLARLVPVEGGELGAGWRAEGPAASANKRSSVTDPIRVDWLHKAIGPMEGRLGVTFAPGKRGPSMLGPPWARSLDLDLDRLRAVHGVDVLISLMEDLELEEFQIADLVGAANLRGIAVIRSPIVDGEAPTLEQGLGLAHTALALARGGLRVVFHCRGGLGRSGTLGASTLVLQGMSARKAISETRRRREGAIESEAQERLVFDLEAAILDEEEDEEA